MELLFLITYVIFIYISIFASLISKKNTSFICLFLCFIFFYDYVFINLSYHLNSTLVYLLKSLQEYILLIILLFIYAKAFIYGRFVINNSDRILFCSIMIPLCIAIGVSVFNNNSITQIISGVRIFFLPIIVPYLLYRNGFLNNVNLNWVENCIIFLGIVSVMYAILQFLTFNGDISSVWFYKFYNLPNGSNSLNDSLFNYIRDGKLRAFSFFISPIMLTTFLALPFILVIIKAFKNSKFYFLLFLFFTYGIYLANTRVGYIMILMSLISLIYFKIRTYIKFKELLYIPILLILFTFVLLTYSITDDPSSLGRLIQYGTFMNYFKILGLGIGNENVLINFDSFYISSILMSGIFIILYFFYFFYLLKNIFFINSISYFNNKNKTLILSTLIYSIAFIYAFAFQFIAGSAPFRIMFFLLFLILALLNSNKEISF